MYTGHDDVGGARIKSSGWLVQEQDTCRHYQFHANVDTFAFTSRDPADELITNLYT